MKPHKLLLIISFIAFSTSNIFAQNNDMKARMEFEDAETAYQNQDYSKAVTHLESAEKLLGKPTGKTRYLLILALNKNLAQDYEYQDLEKLKKISKHYLDNYTTDTEKYRDVYDLSNNLDKNYPKNMEQYITYRKEYERLSLEKQKKENEKKEKEQLANKIKNFRSNLNGVVLGSTYDQMPSSAKNILSVKTSTGYTRKYKSLGQDEAGITSVDISNNRGVYRIHSNFHSGRKKDRNEIYKNFERISNDLINLVGEANVTKKEEINEYWNIVTISTSKNIGYYYEISFQETIKAFNWVFIKESLSLIE